MAALRYYELLVHVKYLINLLPVHDIIHRHPFQYQLRKKVLHNDMTKYSCFRKLHLLYTPLAGTSVTVSSMYIWYFFCSEGYFDVCCCVKAGSCGEEKCPDFCLFMEGCVCNCVAISASRTFVMEKYELSSDPCDYRLIRINNFLQMLACACSILAIFISELQQIARYLKYWFFLLGNFFIV